MRFLQFLLQAAFFGGMIVMLIGPFFYYDSDNGCFIKVIPSFQPSNWNTKEVITLLKNTTPEYYKYMCGRVNTINKNVSCGGFDGGCFYQNNNRTIFVGNDQDNIALTAAIFVHELCHAKQEEEGRRLDELECYKAGSRYLTSIQEY